MLTFKPHGALYNRAVGDKDIAAAIVKAIRKIDDELIHVVLANSAWEDVARNENVHVARECYADRAVTPEGTLVPRSQPGSVIHDVNEVTSRSLRLASEGKVTASDGNDIDFAADTICLHGDTPGAVEMAASVKVNVRIKRYPSQTAVINPRITTIRRLDFDRIDFV